MCVDRIKIEDGVNVKKGNSAIIYELSQDNDLFESFLNAEQLLKVNYTQCVISLRKALEDFGIYYGAHIKMRETGANYEDAKKQVIQEVVNYGKLRGKKNIDRSALPPEISRKKFFIDACGKIRTSKKTELVTDYVTRFGKYSPYSSPSIKIESVKNVAYDIYSACSSVTHGERAGEYKETRDILITLFNIVYAFFGSDYKFEPARIPFGDYFPIPAEHFAKLYLNVENKGKIYIKPDEGNISYYFIKRVSQKGIKGSEKSGRDEEIFDLLWERSLDNPQNIVNSRGEIGEEEYLSKVYKFKGKPYGLKDDFLKPLSFDTRFSLIKRIISAVDTLHSAETPVYLRGLNRSTFYVCGNNEMLVPFIVDFGYAKSTTMESQHSTVLGNIKDLKKSSEERSFIAPELLNTDDSSSVNMDKADVYSVGKLIQILFSDEEINSNGKLSDIVPRMLEENANERMSMSEVTGTFFDTSVKQLLCAVAASAGGSKTMEDAFLIKGSDPQLNKSVCELHELDYPVYAAVFDGMGGGIHGEEIAQLAANETKFFFDNRFDENSYTESFNKMIRYLQEKAVKEREKMDSSHSGCTAVFAFLREEKAYIANVGDSRAYYINSSGVSQISQDHRFSSYITKKGELFQFLGMNEEDGEIDPYISEQNLGSAAYLMLCTDGLSDYVSNDQIFDVVRGDGDLVNKAQALVKSAKEQGSKDDITVIIMGRK